MQFAIQIGLGVLVLAAAAWAWLESPERATPRAVRGRPWWYREETSVQELGDAADARRHARLPLAILLVLLCAGTFGTLALTDLLPQRVLDSATLWQWTWRGGLACSAAFIAWIVVRVGASKARDRVLVLGLTLGPPAFVMATGVAICVVDVAFDASAPQLVEVTNARTWSTVSGGGYRSSRRVHYHLAFVASDDRLRDASPLRIDATMHEHLQARWQADAGGRAVLAWHAGALGLPWVEVRD